MGTVAVVVAAAVEEEERETEEAIVLAGKPAAETMGTMVGSRAAKATAVESLVEVVAMLLVAEVGQEDMAGSAGAAWKERASSGLGGRRRALRPLGSSSTPRQEEI